MLVTQKEKIQSYYQALVNRDSNFIGIFYVGVKTTSIFCISTCRARKPKFENVDFYTTFKSAMDAGFRPCKICRPTENSNEAPEQVQTAIRMVEQNPMDKVSDYTLRQNNIQPEFVRRWFKKNYGMTFQAFQRMYRINNAFRELKAGKKTTDTAFDSGYESLSGFNYTFKKVLGKSPAHSKYDNVILIHRFTTPLGPMFVCATDQGVCLLEFVDRRMLETEFLDIQKRLKAQILAGENDHIKQAKKEMGEYFEGKRKTFSVKLHTPGTEFQNTVWKALQKISYGDTATYQQQAERIHNPKAVRAVGLANGMNRVAIMIPCHRVIGKNGDLTGYVGGLERKKWLLDFEREHLDI